MWHTAPLNDAPIRPALCVKKPDPLAWFWVSFSICQISSLERVIFKLKHFLVSLDMTGSCSQGQTGLRLLIFVYFLTQTGQSRAL